MSNKLLVRGAVIVSVLGIATWAVAQPASRSHRLTDIVDSGPAAPPPAASSAAPAAADAGGKGPKDPETRGKRKSYNEKTGPLIGATLHANGKEITKDERDAIAKHQHRMAVLFRIRSIAEQEGDKGTVERCDKILDRADSKFFEKLRKLNAKAPVKAADGGAK